MKNAVYYSLLLPGIKGVASIRSNIPIRAGRDQANDVGKMRSGIELLRKLFEPITVAVHGRQPEPMLGPQLQFAAHAGNMRVHRA